MSWKLKIDIGPYNTESEALQARNQLIDNYHPYAYDTEAVVKQKEDGKYWVVGSRNKSAD